MSSHDSGSTSKPPNTATKMSNPPVKKEKLEICLDFGQVMINNPLGKVDAKDGGKVRAHAMRQHHHKRQMKSKGPGEEDIVQQKRKVELGKLVLVHSKFQASPMGAGQNDPFMRLPVANPPRRYYELLDHCMTVLWPGLVDVTHSAAFTQDHFLKITKSPVAFYGSLFAASSHLEALRSTRSSYNAKIRSELEQLDQKGEAIRAVHLALNDSEPGKQYDELIHAILILGVHETKGDEPEADWSPFSAPLRSLQWIDIYGTRRYSEHHILASKDVIRKRGGPRQVRMHGVAWLMASMELNSCVVGLLPPEYPLLDPDGIDVEYKFLYSSSATTAYTDIQSVSGFLNLHELRFFPELTYLLPKIRHYSHLIELTAHGIVPPDIMGNRNWVIHRILSLPSAAIIVEQTRFLSHKFERTILVYEMCRLTCLMYGIHVIFPTPRSRAPRERLLPLLQESIRKVSLEGADQVKELSEMMLWCLFIGGIAATGRAERTWFVEQLKTLSRGLGISELEWAQTREVLRRFAWVDVACDPGGEALWSDVLLGGEWRLGWSYSLPILSSPGESLPNSN